MNESPAFSLQPDPEPDRRGSRLPFDWKPTDKEVARAKGLRPDVDVAREAILFRNFWTNKSGKDGRMIDWGRTWDSWILKAPASRTPQAPRVNPSPVTPDGKSRHMSEAQLEANRQRVAGLLSQIGGNLTPRKTPETDAERAEAIAMMNAMGLAGKFK